MLNEIEASRKKTLIPICITTIPAAETKAEGPIHGAAPGECNKLHVLHVKTSQITLKTDGFLDAECFSTAASP